MKDMKALRYLRRLIRFESTSHLSNRYISKYLEIKLRKHGFFVEKIRYRDAKKVPKVNLIAKKGLGQGGLAYFGHTDTVPAPSWFTKKVTPFEPVISQGRIFGRGACDMKGSLACMLDAAQQVPFDKMVRPLYLVFTADEEVGFGGAKKVVEESKLYREMIKHGTVGVIGEPTELNIVHAHKGSLTMKFRTVGKAAHSSTREGKNANWHMIPFLHEIWKIREETETVSDWFDDRFDPPTMSMNLIMSDGNAAVNVTSPRTDVQVYIRPMPNMDCEPLLKRISQAAKKHDVEMSVKRNCDAFWSDPHSDLVKKAQAIMDTNVVQTVGYATDGGVLTEMEQKIIFGPGSIKQAHTNQEFITLDQMRLGIAAFRELIHHYCCELPTKKIR
ncbi:MAG: M20/M25/M40 family metallo-hydrolase [Planctomycetaceae bacterium]|nr:M20/M25/M40 family metallo-hydrolase [Planctomycetaceae bacterium]